MVTIYIIALEQEKYYVGKTQNINIRLEDHFNSIGSEWTKKYKPINVIEIINDCDEYDEDKYTIKYMRIFGIDNVRGGSFCKFLLSNDDKKILQRMINGSTDKCYKCGGIDHFAKDCNNKDNEWDIIEIDKNECYRCGRFSHFANKCYAKTHVKGYDLESSDDEIFICDFCNKEFDSENDIIKHQKKCKRKDSNNKCYRCGRTGHYMNDCYANKHIKGYYIDD